MRECVYDIVYAVLVRGEKSDEVFHKLVRDAEPDKVAMIKRLSYGAIEYATQLDAVIQKYTNKKPDSLDEDVRICLLMAFHEILYADSVPEYATANEIVNLAEIKCKKNIKQKKSYINANIRTFLRDRESGADCFEGLRQNELLSLPDDLWEMLVGAYGKKTAKKIGGAFLQRQGEVTLNIDTSRISIAEYEGELKKRFEGIEVMPGRYMTDALIIRNSPDVRKLYGFDEGLFYVQDESSMLPVTVSGIRPGDTVIDVCGAPGGKSIHALMRLGGEGMMSIRDVSDGKVAKIRENLSRYPYENYECKVFDGRKTDEKWHERADVLLLDVPCSGIGIIGRKPELKYNCVKNAKELTGLQREIIDASVQMLKPGGTLIFSTCTINPDENDRNTDYLIEKYGFIAESLDDYIPDSLKSSQTASGRLTALPGIYEMDGFYVARLHKNG
ncbi:MAG: hypothetical protein K5639_03420 [Eubacterium sp.]|nr:hypothetical protein [Eubacterium sp.]